MGTCKHLCNQRRVTLQLIAVGAISGNSHESPTNQTNSQIDTVDRQNSQPAKQVI